MILTVIKRDGRIVGFNEEKIKAAIRKAMLSTEKGEDNDLLCQISDRISYIGKDECRRNSRFGRNRINEVGKERRSKELHII